ncbi:MAG: hypothetical protein JXB39_14450 [Deltaproteobacteria bacterium]|nr:hypothetical protein [Deltaproteobacteria bacterium]
MARRIPGSRPPGTDGGSSGFLRRAARLVGRETWPPLDRLAALAGPVARLLARDRRTGMAWARKVLAVVETLGEDHARQCTDLLAQAVERDPEEALRLAETLPDHLACVAPADRRRLLRWVGWALDTQPRSVSTLVEHLPALLPVLEDGALRSFLDRGLASPERAAAFLRLESEASREAMASLRPGVALEEVTRILSLYATAHCGQEVRIRAAPPEPIGPGRRGAPRAFADGHDIHLPARMDTFGDGRDFRAYRVATALAAGMIEFGTFDLILDDLPGVWPARREGEVEHERLFRGLGVRSLARDLFGILEEARVEARIEAAYPGLARDLAGHRADLPDDRPPLTALAPVDQAVEILARRAWHLPRRSEEDRELDPGARAVLAVLLPRLERVRRPEADVADSARALVEVWPAVSGLLARSDEPVAGREPGLDPLPGGAQIRSDLRDARAWALDERALALVAALRAVGTRLGLGEARAQVASSDWAETDAWLAAHEAPAGPLAEARDEPSLSPVLREGVDPGHPLSGAGFLYPEWDHTVSDRLPDRVRVREYALARGSSAFADEVLDRRRPLVAALRRQFEALRPDDVRRVRGLAHGDELDMDRVVEDRTVRRAGGSPSERLYARRERADRSVAVAFLLDLSSSTNEVVTGTGQRIVDVEKEALVLIAEAVDALGDAFAIWGFSGYGREQVAFYVAKSFDEPWGPAARERIGAIGWRMENRDGAAIRHASRRLLERPARTRLLVLLSDGKPLDCGCERYADAYAQEDTRMALLEARQAGLHPFCITVDPHSREYLPRMYGASSYTVIERVESLPARLPAIYRRLTV